MIERAAQAVDVGADVRLVRILRLLRSTVPINTFSPVSAAWLAPSRATRARPKSVTFTIGAVDVDATGPPVVSIKL